jgi:hypothetical protein
VAQQVTKNQLDGVMPRWLLAEIEDKDTGLNNGNIQDIFNHVFDCRGQIDDALVDGKQITHQTAGKAQILSSVTHTRAVETQMKTSNLYPGGQ